MQLFFLFLLIVTVLFIQQMKRQGTAPGGRSPGRSEISETISRLMNQRAQDSHPADNIDDARLAASGVIVAVATLDSPLSQAEISAMTGTMQQTFDVTEREALDIVSFGRWIAVECGGAEEAVERLGARIDQLAGPEAGPDMVRMIKEVSTADGNALGAEEEGALQAIRRILDVD